MQSDDRKCLLFLNSFFVSFSLYLFLKFLVSPCLFWQEKSVSPTCEVVDGLINVETEFEEVAAEEDDYDDHQNSVTPLKRK